MNSACDGGLFKLLKGLGLVTTQDASLLQRGVRGNKDTSVFKDNKTGVIWLNDTVGDKHYVNMVSYWDTETLAQAREKCKLDDERRIMLVKEFGAQCSLLDVGTGCGGFLKLATSHFSLVHGVELQKSIIKTLSEHGLKVYPSIPKASKYDIVTMFHVFEHLEDPMKVLKEVYEALEENGTLIVEVPHARDALISMYGCDAFRKFTFWEEHLILHTKTSLKVFLTQAGFRNVSVQNVQRYPLANHLYWLSEGKPGGQHVLNVTDNGSYENYLIEKDATDTIIAFAKK